MGRVSSSLIFFTKTKNDSKCGILVASEWENLFSRNERSRKTQVYVVNAEIAQLVEHNLAKVRVASSSLVFRSKGQNLTSALAQVAEW